MTSAARIAFRPHSLSGALDGLAELRLAGSRCKECGIALFGERRRCENCAGIDLQDTVFSADGTIFSYTVQRYPPPQPNDLPEPWQPRPIAWIDLDNDGPRILAPLDCSPDDVRIGGRVRLQCVVGWTTEDGQDVVTYGFVPADPAERD